MRERLPALLFFSAIAVLSSVGVGLFLLVVLGNGWQWADALLLTVFALLFSYLSFGFCHALFGFLRERYSPPAGEKQPAPESSARVALVMPIHNEEVSRVFHGLRATFASLREQEAQEHFDVYLLSDSTEVENWIREEEAWLRWINEEKLANRVYYRHRASNEGKKAGNIADFCNEYGDRYQYMAVLDADSIMTGETLVEMRECMLANPQLALLQTVPRMVGAATAFGRLQQFANRVYGGLFLSGLSYWQGEGGNFWGHNAMIHLKAFRECCALPHLPGPGGLGGSILSHDFVEAGLLRAAGWEVRLAEDLSGSYEEGPQSLLEAARRDRRWCEGNLQHITFLFAKGLRQRTRIHLANGIMGYLASPLWLALIVLSLLLLSAPAEARLLSPTIAGILFALTLILLFVPKILCLLDLLNNPDRVKDFGGKNVLIQGVLLESCASVWLAPINMAFHTQFVLSALLGQKVRWDAQDRTARGTRWAAAWRVHRSHFLLGCALIALAALTGGTTALLFTLPVTLPLVISPIISVRTSRQKPCSPLTTPEELSPPPVLKAALNPDSDATAEKESDWLRRALLEPQLHAAHIAHLPPSGEELLDKELIERVLQRGPHILSPTELTHLVASRYCLEKIHLTLWETPAAELSPYWQNKEEAA